MVDYLKLDILGHDDPTVLRMFKDLTGLDPQTIPLVGSESYKSYLHLQKP